MSGTKQKCTGEALFMYQKSVIHIFLTFPRPFKLCAPRTDCAIDGRSRLLRRETGGFGLLQRGETYNGGGVFYPDPYQYYCGIA